MSERNANRSRALPGGSPSGWAIPCLLMTAIIAGALIGHLSSAGGAWLGGRVDVTLLTLVTLLIFGVRPQALQQLAVHYRFVALALLLNFAVVPFIGYGIAWLFLGHHPLFMVGLVIYFMAPCTDWFLGFTRLSRGNVAVGMTLIPLNMTLQLLLYPFYVHGFAHDSAAVDAGVLGQTLLHWFLVPLVIAIGSQLLLRGVFGARGLERVSGAADAITPVVIALLVMEIFAGNIATLLDHPGVVGWMLLAVFVFFFTTFWLGEGVSRLCRLRYREHALLTMTIAARNAPLMLAVTMVAMPGQPVVYAALVIGMLIEFPHLTLLRQVLLRTRTRMATTPETGETAACPPSGAHPESLEAGKR